MDNDTFISFRLPEQDEAPPTARIGDSLIASIINNGGLWSIYVPTWRELGFLPAVKIGPGEFDVYPTVKALLEAHGHNDVWESRFVYAHGGDNVHYSPHQQVLWNLASHGTGTPMGDLHARWHVAVLEALAAGLPPARTWT